MSLSTVQVYGKASRGL